ncbi:shikimate kinase [Trichlorobacter ammonificans]|uniref:Shikimate kinase n=1 Tax=Trichlorobacter ammonificans TaxID=2916410 RepID=A0ABN8HKR0_9BACT|nr:shikimate kinase [Trichlorobacter ammonificans]CAH2032166.1 Shikimate kinase [Trichlorobacter ammonificans]
MNTCIVLTGPMGSGKTSVGRLLATQLGYDFVDLDALIVELEGSSITEVFARGGEQAFREMETAALATLGDRTRMVLSTGGGVVLREENRLLLRMIGVVVNLTASATTLAQRLALTTDRPLLAGSESREERISRILQERESFYADADIRIDTTGKTLEDVAAEIRCRLAEKASGAP